MMKNMKRLAAVLLVLVMVLALAGCGKMTPEKLTVKTAAALAGKPMTSMEMELGMTMSLTAEGFSMDMDMAVAGDMVMDSDPYQSYTNMEMTMDLMGQSITETSETYVLVEDDQLTTYTYAESMDIWTKTSVPFSPEAMAQQSSYDWLAELSPDMLTLAEETQILNERKVYVLNCTITGEQLQAMMDSMPGMADTMADAGMSGPDMTALTVPAVFYIDAETFLPAKIEMEIQGMDEMMAGMMEESLGADMEALGMEMEIGTVRMVYAQIGYEDVTVPTLPAEAMEEAVEA